MPTLNSHTHCQVAQADTQAKTWQRVCLFHHATNRQSGRKKNTERTTGVWRQWRVTWLNENSTSHQLLWCIDSFELRNPPLRQAPNRWRQFYRDDRKEKQN
jgi:hypothetical protein